MKFFKEVKLCEETGNSIQFPQRARKMPNLTLIRNQISQRNQRDSRTGKAESA